MKSQFQVSNSFKGRDLGIYLIALSIITFAILKGSTTVGFVGARSTDKTLSDDQIIEIQKKLAGENTSNYWNQITLLIKHSRFNEAEKALRRRFSKLDPTQSSLASEYSNFYLKLGEIELRQAKFNKSVKNFEQAFSIAKAQKLKLEKIEALRYLFETTRQTYKFSDSAEEKEDSIENFNKYLSLIDDLKEEELSDPSQRNSLTNTVKLCLIEFGRFLEVEECVQSSQ